MLTDRVSVVDGRSIGEISRQTEPDGASLRDAPRRAAAAGAGARPALTEHDHAVTLRPRRLDADPDVDADDPRRLTTAELDVDGRVVLQPNERLRQTYHRFVTFRIL